MTYTQLKADIADYLHRTDLTDKIPGFIRLAESPLFRDIAPKETETRAIITTVNGYADLPTDFHQLSKITRTVSGRSDTLKSTDYALEGGQVWIDSDLSSFTLFYMPVMPALSDSVQSNWILENGYDAYLYASALEGAKYLRNAEQVATLLDLVGRTITSIKSKSVVRDIPVRGSLQIRRA